MLLAQDLPGGGVLPGNLVQARLGTPPFQHKSLGMQLTVEVEHQECSEQRRRGSAHLHLSNNFIALASLYSLVQLIKQRGRLLGLRHAGRWAVWQLRSRHACCSFARCAAREARSDMKCWWQCAMLLAVGKCPAMTVQGL